MMDDATMVAIIDDTLKKHQDDRLGEYDRVRDRMLTVCICNARLRDADALRTHQSVQVYAALRDAVITYVAMSGGLKK